MKQKVGGNGFPMPVPTADSSRNVLQNVENLFNQELVDRVFEDLSISGDKLVAGAAAGVGFDTLSNALIVDPSFTSTTSGWGVTSFDNISTAQDTVVANGAFIIVNGNAVSAEAHTWTVSYNTTVWMFPSGRINVWGLSDHLIVDAGSSLSITGGALNCSTNDIFGTIILLDVFMETGVVMQAGSTLLMRGNNGYTYDGVASVGLNGAVNAVIQDCIIATLKGTAWVPSIYSMISGNHIRRIDGLGTDIPFYRNTVWNSWLNVNTIDPLNHSNIFLDVTYLEVVTFASLPAAAAGNTGATAMTSDGGYGSVPALMVSNGTTWEVLDDTNVLPKDANLVTIGATYTTLAADGGADVLAPVACTFTCGNGLADGFQQAVFRTGAGVVTVSASTTLQKLTPDTGLETVASVTINTAITLTHLGSDVWLVAGDYA